MENPYPLTTSYEVSIDVYQGPLALLLQLIEKAELDITKVSLAKVTNPFLEYIRNLSYKRAEEVSHFLLIAARLMQIKSEALLPRPPEREEGEEDPAQELIEQLLIYKQYKKISEFLKEKHKQGLSTYLRMAPPPKVEGKLDLSNLDLDDLIAAATLAHNIAAEKVPMDNVVSIPKITIREKITMIARKLNKSGKSNFLNLLGDDFSRVDIIVTFLAILELIKRDRVNAHQESLFGDIEIMTTEYWDSSEDFSTEFVE